MKLYYLSSSSIDRFRTSIFNAKIILPIWCCNENLGIQFQRKMVAKVRMICSFEFEWLKSVFIYGPKFLDSWHVEVKGRSSIVSFKNEKKNTHKKPWRKARKSVKSNGRDKILRGREEGMRKMSQVVWMGWRHFCRMVGEFVGDNKWRDQSGSVWDHSGEYWWWLFKVPSIYAHTYEEGSLFRWS